MPPIQDPNPQSSSLPQSPQAPVKSSLPPIGQVQVPQYPQQPYPTVNQPYIVPNAPSKFNPLWIVVGCCGGCFILIIIGIIASSILSYKILDTVKGGLGVASTQLCADVKNAKNFSDAFSKEYKINHSDADIANIKSQLDGCQSLGSTKSLSSNTVNGKDTIKYEGSINYVDNSTKKVSVVFVNENGSYKIDSIVIY